MGIALPEPEKPPDYEVWPENWDALCCFSRSMTQWNVGGLGQVTGLNYASVWTIIKMYSYENPLAVFEDVQVMEVAAIALINKGQK